MKAGLPRGKNDLSAIRSFNFESDNEENINGDELSDLSDVFEDIAAEEITSKVPVECISLDDITYDRDLKWINVPNGARPKPIILQGNKFLKQVQTITRDSSTDLHALDDRYAQMDDRKRNHDKKFLVEFDDDIAANSRNKRGNTRERRRRPEATRAPAPAVRIAKPSRQSEARGGAESEASSSDAEGDEEHALKEPAAGGQQEKTKQSSRRERGGRGRGRDSAEQRADQASGRGGGRERGGRGRGGGGGAREILEDGTQAPVRARESRGGKAEARKPEGRKPARHDFDDEGVDLAEFPQNYTLEEMEFLPPPPARGGRGLRGVTYQHPNAGRQSRAQRQGRGHPDVAAQEPALNSYQPGYYPGAESYEYYSQQYDQHPAAPPGRRGQQQQQQPQQQHPQAGVGRGQRGGGRRAPRSGQAAYAAQEYSPELQYYPDGSYYEPYPYEPYEPYAAAQTAEHLRGHGEEYDSSAFQAGGWEDDSLAAAAAREARLNPQAAAFVPTWMKAP
jgi:hypothetical protein